LNAAVQTARWETTIRRAVEKSVKNIPQSVFFLTIKKKKRPRARTRKGKGGGRGRT
jgi:hypothetical protein